MFAKKNIYEIPINKCSPETISSNLFVVHCNKNQPRDSNDIACSVVPFISCADRCPVASIAANIKVD